MNCKKRWVDISGKIGITFYLLLWCSVNAIAATGSEIATASKFTHHAMTVTLDPATSELKVTTQITLSDSAKAGQEIQFLLHKDLQVQSAQQNLREQPVTLPALKKMLDTAAVPMKEYRVTLPDGANTLTLSYHGKISHALDENNGGTPGLISSDGVFLAHSTAWYPAFSDNELVTFDVQIRLPKDWGAVSQGELRKDEVAGQQRVMQWVELHPQDDIYIVASRYHEYQQEINGIKAMVFLRAKDEALADRYIKATGQYIALYNELIGPYPYKKFALVENFWETGYGMPSFTLLGSRVIRFPFIIYTSYPHEILHNYWGNGVFVDYESGNWSEGLTAYLADHLFKEQRGEGAEYRRSVLQKYTDFVNESRDFPLTEFRSRHSSATEAVGYGKTLMLFHMLRLQLGDEKFKTALQVFYQQFQFRFAAFADVEKVFSGTSGRALTAFFQQWVNQAGAPSLSVSEAIVKHNDNSYQLGFKLTQSQSEAAYQLNVPVVIYFQDQSDPHQATLQLNSKQQKYSLEFNRKPVIIDIDPSFDVFRRLDSREIPAAISQGFGDDRPLLILPGKANPQQLTAYRALADQWQKQQMQSLEIKTDAELTELPAGRSIWILGWENRFKEAVVKDLKIHGLAVTEKTFSLMEQSFDKKQHALMVATRHPQNLNKTLLWLSSDNLDAIPGLARKLPHYRKYSYLVFKGDAPDNIVKGQWEIIDSPMRVVLDKEAAKTIVKVKARTPLVSPSR